MNDAAAGLEGLGGLAALLRIKAEHDRAARGRINLYAGSNVTSPAVERALAWGWGSMPAMGPPFAKDQPGTDHLSALERLVEDELRALFGAAWAEARLPSCTIANAAVFHVFGGPGRLLASPGAANGGHVSARADGTPAVAGMRVVALPYEADGFHVDDEAAAALVRRERPAILFLGCSIALSVDLPPRAIAAAREGGTVVVYDASHVLGLIAGGRAPNPLAHGADLVTASTYKSFGGPPGAVVLGADAATEERLRAAVCPTFSSNYDAGRLAGLCVAASEAREHMPAYADAMVAAAACLRAALRARGLETLPRDGEAQATHQFLLAVGTREAAGTAMRRLEAQGIVVGANLMPPGERYGLRIGTQVLARCGYDADDLGRLADLMVEALDGREVGGRVAALAGGRSIPGFCSP